MPLISRCSWRPCDEDLACGAMGRLSKYAGVAGVAGAAMLVVSLGLSWGAVRAEAANPARHLLTRSDLRGLHFGLTYGGNSHERGCRVANRYRETPQLDSNALSNSVAFCPTTSAARGFYGDPLSAYDRCRPLRLRAMQESTACLSTVGGGRMVTMRRGRRVAELSSDSPKVGGLSRRTLLRLARIQARRIY
jgi:hypothetical protein